MMLCDVRSANPRDVISPVAVLNSGDSAVVLRHAGNWLSTKSNKGTWHSGRFATSAGQ